MEARPQGFRLGFTKPVDAASAQSAASYAIGSFTYIYQSRYGGDEVEKEAVPVERAEMAKDRMSVILSCGNLREGYVHELRAAGVRSAEGEPLLHPEAFYTLNRIPE
jgi:hypothetical protein